MSGAKPPSPTLSTDFKPSRAQFMCKLSEAVSLPTSCLFPMPIPLPSPLGHLGKASPDHIPSPPRSEVTTGLPFTYCNHLSAYLSPLKDHQVLKGKVWATLFFAFPASSEEPGIYWYLSWPFIDLQKKWTLNSNRGHQILAPVQNASIAVCCPQ